MAAESIRELLARGRGDAPALIAPGRAPLAFAALARHSERTVARLRALGVGRRDRVAIVLPNGPEMAAAFLTIAQAAATAPLNPGYKAEEFEFYLADLEPKALVVQAGEDSAACAVAGRLGIGIIELRSERDREAGLFTLETAAPARPAEGGPAAGDDVALLLHTSGTTSRPKLVPLTQQNLAASAEGIARTLVLGTGDRCLNVMPLFHIHGLMAGVLASLAAGGSVFLTPGFNALRFFAWLEESRATWYTAVPTMHQAILARAERNLDAVRAARLRFIRSSSSSLPPQVMAELERVFGCPVIESYGMTEAAHQMTSNPLPPAARKPGSVGLPAGPEVSVVDAAGRKLGAETTGEVVIRGPSVTGGYLGNPEANAQAFTDGWFRTGDLGAMDADGYLRIIGRLKEIINRGGEKISPREVDEVLLDHPAVAQAVTFALPHPKLGEEVAAAIVLREGASATESEIREFAQRRIADFKVPRRVVFVAEIPKGPTGKLTRIGLAEKLGLVA